MQILVLEDNPDRQDSFRHAYPQAVIVATAPDCIELILQEWDIVYLDHDLGGGRMPDCGREDCGYEVVREILEHQPEHLRRTQFIVHSANPLRSRIMAEDLRRAGYNAVHKSFINLLPELRSLQ